MATQEILDKIIDRYTVAEFVELIEMDYDDLKEFILHDMSDYQLQIVLEDLRLEESDEGIYEDN